MTQYFIKVKSSAETVPSTEPEYWSRQIISESQANIFYNLGNCGLGVPNPLAKLQVDGNVGIGSAFATYTPPVDGLIVSGNVGIGTSAPAHRLHVIGNARIEGNLIVNGTQTIVDTNVQTTERLDITNDGTGPALRVNQIGDADVVELLDDGVSALCIKNGGFVGIGTTDPKVRLHVEGDLYTSTNRFKALFEDTGSSVYFQMMAIRADGELLTWGRGNTRGHNLGIGNAPPTNTLFPRRVAMPFGKKVAQVTMSFSGTTALTTDGQVWAWGLGAGGGNGDGTVVDRWVPVFIPTVGTVIKVFRATGIRTTNTATFYLNAEGDIYMCGTHTVLPTYSTFTKMARPNNNAKWKDFNASGFSIWAWTEDSDENKVYGMGLNTNGQLADGTIINRTVWTPVIKADNSVLTNIREVKWATELSGIGTIMFIQNNGDLYTAGYNFYGEGGIGNVVNPQTKANFVIGGVRLANMFNGTQGNAVVVKTDGTLWAWGYNAFGTVGNGTAVNVTTPIQIRENGTSGNFITGVTSIHGSSASEDTNGVFIIKEDGSVWTAGWNISSHLGVGDSSVCVWLQRLWSAG